jgi:4-diphosphocytidyl-2-C-methyl-D-erythritol kinase
MHWYPAPAKLNLFLHVVGRRVDGYHELQTVFRILDFGDRLAFSVRSDGAVLRSRELPGIPEETDVTLRAARLLKERTGCTLGADIVIDKRIPIGGGLGGGSSDAATTLLVLNRLWRLDLSAGELLQLGLQLGADVPIFIFGCNAFAEGIGEVLTPIALPSAWYVVLCPPVEVPTRLVFADPELTRNTNRIKMSAFFAGAVNNDLEPVVCRLFPVVRKHLDWLQQQAPARLTGSGACVFASFDDESAARRVFARKPPDMQGFVARGLEQHPLRGMILGSSQVG